MTKTVIFLLIIICAHLKDRHFEMWIKLETFSSYIHIHNIECFGRIAGRFFHERLEIES